MIKQITIIVAAVLWGAGCERAPAQHAGACETDNAGLKLPDGFCASIFADDVGNARHIVTAANGDVYVALEGRGGILALRDTNADNRADVLVKTEMEGGSGIALRDDLLYFSTPTVVLRYRIDAQRFGQLGTPDTIVRGMPEGGHSSRSLALGDSSDLFVAIGSASNVCQGQDPCAELATRAAIWKFDSRMSNQTTAQGIRYATGIRNAVGLVWNPAFRSLFATQHGRDRLEKFKELYSTHDADILPSEEFVRVAQGSDFGWPFCYHDWRRNRKVLAPEYGGDGASSGRCTGATQPLMGFPGHWAPNGLIFYDGEMFPERYRGGALIAFHGSWNRSRQDGYKVAFVPFTGAMPSGDYEIFADGFAGGNKTPNGARHRPVGMSVAPNGSLYITDDQRGRIYNIQWNEKDTSAR